MNGHQNRFGPFMGKELPAIAHHSHFTAHYRASGGGSHRYDQLRVYSRYFCLKPRPARGYFCSARFGVDASLASWRKLEMLTALVTYSSERSTRAASSARFNSFPAGPTNGRPC